MPVILQDWQGNTYVYGLDLISSTDGGGAQTYYLYDGPGSTTRVIDGESGVAVSEYEYDVFGEPGGASEDTFLFTGEQYDAKARRQGGLRTGATATGRAR